MLISFVVNTVCKIFTGSLLYSVKSAPDGRFFASALLLFCKLCANTQADGLPSHCDIRGNTTQPAEIRFVIDGDTLVLENGEKVRLIGLDTPELGHDRQADEPGAVAARDYLLQMFSADHSVRLVYDSERQDKYGRTLAHLFLYDGTNVQAKLLADGYATPLTIPPNLAFLICYQQQTGKARNLQLGLWSLSQYRPIKAHELTGRERGYHIIEGNITHIGESQSSIWLNMGKNIAVRILRDDLAYFKTLAPKAMVGRTVTIRGMVYQRKRQLRMRIRHPVDLIVNSPGSGIQ